MVAQSNGMTGWGLEEHLRRYFLGQWKLEHQRQRQLLHLPRPLRQRQTKNNKQPDRKPGRAFGAEGEGGNNDVGTDSGVPFSFVYRL